MNLPNKDDLLGITFEYGKNKQRGLLSPEDKDLAELSWGKANGYVQGCRNNIYKNKLLHRVVLERMLGRSLSKLEFVDHKNRNRSDNRRENLRLSNNSLNQTNRGPSKRSTTGYKGAYVDVSAVRKNRVNIYRSMIRVNNRNINLGSFSTALEAAEKYDEAAKLYFGEFAFTNF